MDNKRRILVVDDDSKSRRVFETMLKAMGFETMEAHDGENALQILATDPYFDLIITDVMMPYLTGFDLAHKLKEYMETRDIPVIGASAFHDWEKSRSEHELEVDGFIQKPVNSEALKREIERVLDGR